MKQSRLLISDGLASADQFVDDGSDQQKSSFSKLTLTDGD